MTRAYCSDNVPSPDPPLAAATQPARDRAHDLDFHLGKWRTHISRLEHPLARSTTCLKYYGTLVVRRVWGGRAQLEELEADGPGGHMEDLLLFLYNPHSRQWSLNAAASNDGAIGAANSSITSSSRAEWCWRNRSGPI